MDGVTLLNSPIHSVSVMPPRKDHRQVDTIRWVELREIGPFGKTRSKRTCVKRGHTYERKVGRELRDQLLTGELESGELHANQWLLFSDSQGINWAQPDYYIVYPKVVLLIEAKLTQTDTATPQLLSLYRPLLAFHYDRPVLCVQVCQNLRHIPPRFIESPQEVLDHPGPGVHTWHFRY